MVRLAIISSHPIQYYAPWFRYLHQLPEMQLKVFYLWDFGVTPQQDVEFKATVQWDIPLLDGYDYEFVTNISKRPGTKYFWGLNNPALTERVKAYNPQAVLLMNYNYASVYRFLWQWPRQQAPLMFRGDSHILQVSHGVKSWLKRQWICQIYRQFDACLYVGQANRQYFEYHGVPSERLFFAPHAIDNNRFLQAASQAIDDARQWKQELGIPHNHRVILFAGKFTEKKRPQDLLQAFLQAKLQQVSLLFVGAGPLEADLRQAAHNIPHVYFAPFQNQSKMPRTYGIASVVVLPSYGHGETWGLAINEAMCLGKPVIVSEHVGCANDLVRDNGWVFPAGNRDFLADCLKQAFVDPTELAIKGEHSCSLIHAYSYQQTTKGLQQAIASCM